MSQSLLLKGEIPVNCGEIGGSKTCGGVTEGEGEIPLLPTRWSEMRCCGENSGHGRPFIHSELDVVLQWPWLVRRSVRQANRLKRVPNIQQQPRDDSYDAGKPETVTTISLHPQGRSSVVNMVWLRRLITTPSLSGDPTSAQGTAKRLNLVTTSTAIDKVLIVQVPYTRTSICCPGGMSHRRTPRHEDPG